MRPGATSSAAPATSVTQPANTGIRSALGGSIPAL